MRITRIENSKHVQERVLVFLEEGDPLRITGHELLQFGLYPGMDLSPQLVVQLQAAGQRSESRVKAAQLASGRMLSRKELTDKLSRKGIDPDTAEETADWLESLGADAFSGCAALETMKNMQALDQQVTIRSAMNAKNREEIEELAKKLVM